MGARRLGTALREAIAPLRIVTERVTWGELGCPKETGVYRAGQGRFNIQLRVKLIHILAAENDPAALFTVVVHRPPIGPAEFALGHRVD